MSLSRGPDDFVANKVFMEDVSGYQAERIATVKRQKIDDGHVLPLIALAVGVQWLPGTTCKTIFDDRGDCKRYLGIFNDATDSPDKVPAVVAEDIDGRFAQEALIVTSGR